MKEFYQIFYYKERLLLLKETAKNSEILMHNMKKAIPLHFVLKYALLIRNRFSNADSEAKGITS